MDCGWPFVMANVDTTLEQKCPVTYSIQITQSHQICWLISLGLHHLFLCKASIVRLKPCFCSIPSFSGYIKIAASHRSSSQFYETWCWLVVIKTIHLKKCDLKSLRIIIPFPWLTGWQYILTINQYGYGSKLGTPKLWMVNTKLDFHICGLLGLPYWPTSVYSHSEFWKRPAVHRKFLAPVGRSNPVIP